MLKKISVSQHKAMANRRVAIVASKYNQRYVDCMLKAAQAVLKEAGVAEIKVVRVPGAYEIPVVAEALARAEVDPFHAIICLGVVIQGETEHARLISEGVSQVLAQIQVTHCLPVIHGVLLLHNEEQARVRCLDKQHNRGTEAAQTALAMVDVMGRLAWE